MNRCLRPIARALMLPILWALLLTYRMGLAQFITISRLLACLPGRPGVSLRARWYRRTLAACGENLQVDWMAAIKTPETRVGSNVYIGTFCWVSWADIGDNVMLGGHITILSGSHHHGFERLDVPINQQHGELSQVVIGENVWVGNGAIILADVAPGTVVAAGSVVNKSFESDSVLAGVPARFLRHRGSPCVVPPREGASDA